MAAVSLPQARNIALGTLSSQVAPPHAMIVVAGSPSAKSHRSRAPPPARRHDGYMIRRHIVGPLA